ncbi:MAG: NAD(P)H-hydrate epimerase [Phycisphaerales bacterium]|nr:NAD(P)H-hydrate epimerase [Phycisphaerales bacterium]
MAQRSQRSVPTGAEPVLSRAAVRAVDAEAIERFGIPGIVLMENAARGLTEHVVALAERQGRQRVVVICGPGNNGGDGYAAARHLHNAGLEVVLVPLAPCRAGSDAAVNAEICRRMDLPETTLAQLGSQAHGAVVIDAVLGTGLDREPSGVAGEAIDVINRLAVRGDAAVVAADLPSGLDADRGSPLGRAVRAELTVTFAANKPGLARAEAAPWTGRVVVVDIGVPRELIERLAASSPDAGRGPRS